MKRFVIFTLIALLLLSLVGCSNPIKSNKPAPQVHYDTTLMEWLYRPDVQDEVTKRLVAIDVCEYGTAGASLKQLSATVGLVQLTVQQDFAEKLSAYLKAMDDTQRDFFSFQWQMRMKDAKLLLTPGNVLADMLSDVGLGNLDLSIFSQTELNRVNNTVLEALKEYGVTDQWKNHRDIEPFAHWSE